MNKKGFTLIELLGVILIISLLVIIVLPKITNSVNNFSSKTDTLTLSMIKDAAKLYVEDNSNKFVKQNGSNYCVSILDLVDANYLKGPIEYQGEDITSTKGFKITYNDGFEYTLMNAYNGSCNLSDYIKKLYKETKTTKVNDIEYSLDETHLLMNDRLGSSDVNKTDGNIRYYGANPNNYIDIGDRDSNGNIIFWRIIGVFKDIEVTDENDNVIGKQDLVKIIRSDFLTSGSINSFSWDYPSTGEYDNNWNDSTLQKMLNDEINGYYGSGEIKFYNNSTTPIELNFASTGLSSEAHSKVERVKWSIRGPSATNIYVDEIYIFEKAGTNKWSGKIGLMHASDYGYSVDMSNCQSFLINYNLPICQANNWIYDSTKSQWTLVSNYVYTDYVFYAYLDGTVFSGGSVNSAYGVRPVLYLKSNVGIVEEKETSEGLKYFVVELN